MAYGTAPYGAAANLTETINQGASFSLLANGYVGGVQSSATAASNTFVNTWNNGISCYCIGATFVYKPTGQFLEFI